MKKTLYYSFNVGICSSFLFLLDNSITTCVRSELSLYIDRSIFSPVFDSINSSLNKVSAEYFKTQTLMDKVKVTTEYSYV